MAASPVELAARFGFRTDQGRIDAKTWLQGTLFLALPLAVLTLIWFLWAPFTRPDTESSGLSPWETLAAYVYVLFYGFAVLLIAISHYNLSVKRWRDRGWRFSGALAALLPLFALFSGAAHLAQPRLAEVMPYWYIVIIDAALIAIITWNAVELGYLGDHAKK
jgi:uncharacterized membrane protein YhaH (DUF805 family)